MHCSKGLSFTERDLVLHGMHLAVAVCTTFSGRKHDNQAVCARVISTGRLVSLISWGNKPQNGTNSGFESNTRHSVFHLQKQRATTTKKE